MEILGGLTSSQADWAHSSYGQDQSRPAPGRVAVTIPRVCRHMVKAFCYFLATDNETACVMLKCDVRHAHSSIHSWMPQICKLTALKTASPLLIVHAGSEATRSYSSSIQKTFHPRLFIHLANIAKVYPQIPPFIFKCPSGFLANSIVQCIPTYWTDQEM
jgi:hypothetical protein